MLVSITVSIRILSFNSVLATRKTYRAVLSEPKLVIPEGYSPPVPPPAQSDQSQTMQLDHPATSVTAQQKPHPLPPANQKKRPQEEAEIGDVGAVGNSSNAANQGVDGLSKKKKRKKNKQGGQQQA